MEVALLLIRILLVVLLYAFLGLIVVLLWRDVRSAATREATPAARERPARLVLLAGDVISLAGYAIVFGEDTPVSPEPPVQLDDTPMLSDQ